MRTTDPSDTLHVSAALFTWKNGFGVSEASDLSLRVGQWPRTLAIRSPKTNVVRYYFRVLDCSHFYATYHDADHNEVRILND